MAATAVTAWGKPHISMGKSGENGAMATSLKDVGYIKEDTTTLELTKGDVKELYGEGHELVDKMELEGTWTLNFTLVRASIDMIKEMFGLAGVDDNKLAMTTTIVSEPRSYKVDPLLVGAIGVELPNCYTSITPKFATAEGWTIEVEVTSMIPTDGKTAPATLYVKQPSEAA